MGWFNNFSSSLSMLFSMLLFPSTLVSDLFLQVYWTLKPARLFEVFNFVYWLTMPEAAVEILLILISFLHPLHKWSMSLFNATECTEPEIWLVLFNTFLEVASLGDSFTSVSEKSSISSSFESFAILANDMHDWSSQ